MHHSHDLVATPHEPKSSYREPDELACPSKRDAEQQRCRHNAGITQSRTAMQDLQQTPCEESTHAEERGNASFGAPAGANVSANSRLESLAFTQIQAEQSDSESAVG